MHVVVLRKPVYERDRWIAMNLLKAFEEAKRGSLARIADIGVSHVPVPWIAEQVRRWRALAGEDFWPYGVEPNRPTLEAFLQYSLEQGVATKRSEERRVGKEGRSRWAPDHEKIEKQRV